MKKVAVELKPNVYLAVELDEAMIDELKNHDVNVVEAQEQEDPSKKKFILFIPGIPDAAVLIGAAAIGIVGGAATTIGSKIGDKIWPKAK